MSPRTLHFRARRYIQLLRVRRAARERGLLLGYTYGLLKLGYIPGTDRPGARVVLELDKTLDEVERWLRTSEQEVR